MVNTERKTYGRIINK